MSTCIIHVGMHKTGTTSIQNSLNGYSDDNFYYAKLGNSSNHSLPIFSLYSPTPARHHLHQSANRTGIALKAYIEGIQIDLERSITDTGDRAMIISGEGISSLPIESLIEMRNYITQYFDEIKIVAYIRPPAAYINSSFQQKVKGGLGSMRIDTLHRSYKNSFDKFDEAFGEENVHLRKFDPGEFPNKCVVTDFCLRLGINLPKSEIKKANESWCMQAVSFLYIYNKFRANSEAPPLNGQQATSLINRLGLENGKRFRFSPDILEPVLSANRDDISWMEQRLGETLQEDLPDYQLGDIRNEVDLLEVEPDTIKRLVSFLGEINTDGITGKTPEEVALLLKKLTIKMGFASPVNTSRSEGENNTPSPNLSRVNRVKINRAEPHVVAGWAIGSDLNEPVKVALLVNGKKKASTIANEMRKGLYERGIHTTGRCGFVFKFDADKHLKINDEVSIQITGGGSAGRRLIANVEASKQAKNKTTKKVSIELPAKDVLNKLRAQKYNAKEVILHVGHGKTGTSYLQSALALSVNELKALGIDYPAHPSFAAAKLGFISSGNVSADEKFLIRMTDAVRDSKQNKILFSHEGLFLQLLVHHDAFTEAFKNFEIKIILFIRNPVSHMLSTYGQRVKRSRLIDTIADDSRKYTWVKHVNQFIDICGKLNFNLKVVNYSNSKNDLLSTFEQALNIPLKTLILPATKNVNRSLTASEMELQRLFNSYYKGNSSKYISDILCNQLPDIAAEKISLSKTEASKFVDRLSKDVEIANKKLDPDCQYSLSVDDFATDENLGGALTFNREQLEVLVKSICAQLGGGDS